jgi:DNA-directed RNA polymerase subunit RPC12/RpoP
MDGMKRMVATGLVLMACAALAAGTEDGAMWYVCKYCGHKAVSVGSLTGSACQRHPDGPGKGRHVLYEGGEKSVYTCKWCGKRSPDIGSLTSSKCQRHPDGPAAGRHEPAL